MGRFSYVGLMKMAGGGDSGAGASVWPDYSSLSGMESWQLPDERALSRFMKWRSSESGEPYSVLSASPRFGGFRVAPGSGTWRGLIDERDSNGKNVDFYPLVHAGFAQQREAGKTYGRDMSGVTDESMSADARAVADLLARQWAERQAASGGRG